jgi:hypothetical protein
MQRRRQRDPCARRPAIQGGNNGCEEYLRFVDAHRPGFYMTFALQKQYNCQQTKTPSMHIDGNAR